VQFAAYMIFWPRKTLLLMKVSTPQKHFIVLFLLPFTISCASIVSRSSWPYYVESDPSNATITIENKKGREIFKGKTPTIVRLKSGSGYFGKESYVIRYTKPGFDEKKVNVECKLNGWYLGNLLIGGAIGFLIVDPATGAMYRVEGKGTRATLNPSENSHARTLKIVDLNKIPADWHSKLVAVK